MPTIKSAKLAAAAAVAAGGLTLATGLAVAGVLPEQADDTAKEKVASIEQVSTQNRPDTETHGKPDTGTETEAVETQDETVRTESQHQNTAEPEGEHGGDVVDAVQAADADGGKGEEVSIVAKQWGEAQREAHAQNDADRTQGRSAEHRNDDQ